MPSLNEMLAQKERDEARLREEKKAREEARWLEEKKPDEAKPVGSTTSQTKQKKHDAKKPQEAFIDKETWESLLNCVYVTKHKSNRYFLEHTKKVATAKSRCKKNGVPFDPVMIPTTPVIRDIRRSLAFLARTRPKDAEGTIDIPIEEADEP